MSLDNETKIALSEELADVAMELAELSTVDNSRDDTHHVIQTELERLQDVAELYGFNELTDIILWMQQNILALYAHQNQFQQLNTEGHFYIWIELLSALLMDYDEPLFNEFTSVLQATNWPIVANDAHIQNLANSLNPDSDLGASMYSSYVLTWDEDIHPELLEAFFIETPDQVLETTALIRQISAGEADQEAQQLAARLAHTVKGSSAVVGIKAVAHFAHKLEDILEYSVDNPLPQTVAELLIESADCLEAMFDSLQMETLPPQNYPVLLEQLGKTFKQLRSGEYPDDAVVVAYQPDIIVEPESIEAAEILESSYVLAWDEDVHPELLEAFFIETPDQVFETCLLIQEVTVGEADKETRQLAARLAHTIKGSSAVVGIEAVASLAYQLEQILEFSIETSLPSSALNLLTQSSDCLEMMFESLQHGSLPPQNYPELLEQLKHCMQQLKSQTGDLGNTVEKVETELDNKTVAAKTIETEPKVVEVTETKIAIETPETGLEDTNVAVASLKTDFEGALDSEFLIDTSIDDSGTISAEVDQKDTVAAFESKILHWSKEVHPELLAAYLSETPEHIINIVTLLHEIGRGDSNQNSYKNAAHLAHTLKGTSTIVGAETIRDITDKLEFILEQLSNSQSKLSNASALLLTQSAHLLEELYAASLTKQELPANYSEIAEQLRVWQTQLQYEAKAAAKLDHEASQSQSSRSILDFKLPPLQAMLPMVQPSTPFKTKKVSRAKLNEKNLRIPVSQLDELLHFSNELVSGNTQIRDQMHNLLQERKSSNNRNERIRLLLDELEWAVDRQSILSTKRMRGEMQKKQAASTEFDSLEMDSFNELHSIMGLLSELISDEREISTGLNRQLRQFRNQLTVQKKTNAELNASILGMRMEPVQTIVPRLERIIRETCRQTGKQVDFMIEGADLAIDTDILKGLVDPLLHLLRNSIDHGIESAQERKQCNKEAVGNLALSFVQQGNQVLLSIKDDGAGIDAEHIYQQAIKKGLIRQGTRLSYDEKLRLILQAGFSSREQVTELSGRGVGMDVVNSAVKEMSGTLSIHSNVGEGTEIQILLPLTLVAVHTALLEVSGNVVAIPSSNISLIHYLEKDAAKLEKGQWHIDYEEQAVEILSLSKLLGWELTEFNPNINQAILIVDYKKQKYALSIDRILSFQDVVLQTLQPWFSNTLGINGVCLLQNDVVAPVLNIFSLLQDVKQRQAAIHIFHDTQLEQEDINAHKRLLVVDDSLSNRKALSLMLEPIGYEVMTAVNGADALQKVEQQNFALIITDLEMPNINGIELSKALRHQDKTRDIPIIMVTSRSTEKHRKLADEVGINAYLTKPVGLDQLSNSIDNCLHKLEKNNKFKAN